MKLKFKKWTSQNKYYLLILFTVLIFFFPIFKGGVPFPGDLLVNYYEPYRTYAAIHPPSKAQGQDVVRELFPWTFFEINSFKRGEIPFWDPYNFSGNPFMANFQSAIFYPFDLIFFVFPIFKAWSLFIILQSLLAFFFTYFFLREIKLGKTSSFFGGLTFAFSSYMTVWLEYGNIGHTFLWLPLALLFTSKLSRTFTARNFLSLVVILWVSFLSGYIQGFFYIIVILLTYFSFKSLFIKNFKIKYFIYFGIALCSPFLLSLFQLLPTLDLFNYSSRTTYTLPQIEHLLNPWWYAITVVAPNFFGNPATNNHWFNGTFIERVSYIGVIPFILLLYSLFNLKKNKEIVIFAVIALISFFLSFDLFLTKYFFQIPIPFISTGVPTRILSIFQFCGAILAAFGLDMLQNNSNKKKYFLSSSIVFFLIIIGFLFTIFGKNFHIDLNSLNVAKRNLLIPAFLTVISALLVYISLYKRYKFIFVILILLTFLDLFYFFQKITPFSQEQYIYPKTPVVTFLQKNASINRFWGYGGGYIDSNFQTYDKTFSPEGNDPLHLRRYTELLASSGRGQVPEKLSRPDANIAPGFGKEFFKLNPYRQRLLDLLGVKYILSKDPTSDFDTTFPENSYKLIYHDGYYQIYENTQILPRFFLANKYEVVKGRGDTIKKIYERNFNLTTLLLDEKPKLKIDDAIGSVNLLNYSPNKVSFATESEGNNLLFLSDNYYPEWQAYIDGKKTKVLIADYTFRAVSVPRGKHTIEFTYDASSFIEGLKLSIVYLLFLALFIFYLKKYEKK